MAYIAGGLIENEHYNTFINDVIEVWGDVHSKEVLENPANFGYGQPHNLKPKNDGEIVVASDWDALVKIVNDIARAQTSVIGTIPSIVSPNDIIVAISAMTSAIATIRSNRLSIPSSRLQVPSVIGSSLVSTFTGSWTGNAVHEFTVNFNSWDDMRHYFNAGGQIRFSPKFTTLSTSSNDLTWVTLFNEIDFIKFCHTNTFNATQSLVPPDGSGTYAYTNNTGFYDLTNIPKTIYTRTISGMTFSISAWFVGVAGDTGSIQFKLNWDSGTNISSGTIVSNIDIAYSNAAIKVTPPTFNTVTPLSTSSSGTPSLTLGTFPTNVVERQTQRERSPYPNPLSQITINNILSLDLYNVAVSDPEHLKIMINGNQVIANYVYDSAINLEVMTVSNKIGTVKFFRNPSDRYNPVRNVEITSGDIQSDSVFTFTYSMNTKTGSTIDTPISINVKNRMFSWATESNLIYSETNAVVGERLGASTAISDDGLYVVAGAPDGANGVGRALMYKFSNGTYTKINDIPTPSGLAFDAAFGTSVACTKDASRIVVSAPFKTTNSIKSGAVFVFKNIGNDVWVQTTQILPSIQIAGMEFGHSIDISDDGLWLVVGAPKESNDTGAIYVFRRDDNTDNWGFKSKFMSSAGTLTANDLGRQFGYTVSISGKDQYNSTLYAGYTIVAGKPFKAEGTVSKVGAVEVFVNTTGDFVFSQELKNPLQGGSTITTTSTVTTPTTTPSTTINVGSMFGYDAEISTRGDYLVVGSPDYASTNKVGAAHIYKKGSNGIFALDAKTPMLTPSTTLSSFGSSVSMGHDGRTIVIGAQHIRDDGTGPSSTTIGETYVFHKTGLDTENNEIWEQQIKFTPTTGTGHMYGEVALASDNNYLVVGAPESETSVVNSIQTDNGGVYIYNVGVPYTQPAITIDSSALNKENDRESYSRYFTGQFNSGVVRGGVNESVSINGDTYQLNYDSVNNDAIIYSTVGYGVMYVSKVMVNNVDTKVRNFKYYPEFNSIKTGVAGATTTMKYILTEIATNVVHEYTETINFAPGSTAITELKMPSRIHNTVDYGVPTISGGFVKVPEASNFMDAEFFTLLNVKETWSVTTAYNTGDVVRVQVADPVREYRWYIAVHNITGGVSPELSTTADWVEVNKSPSSIVYDARNANYIGPKTDVSQYNVFAPRYSVKTSDSNVTAKITPKFGNIPQEFKFKFKCGNNKGIVFSSAVGEFPRSTASGDGSQDGRETGDWNPSTAYLVGDVVTASDGFNYKASTVGSGDNPVLHLANGANKWVAYDYSSNIGFNGTENQITRFLEHTNVPTINAGQTRYTLSVSGELPLEYVHHLELTGTFANGATKTVFIGDRRLYRNHIRYNTTGTLAYSPSITYAVNDIVKQGEDYFYAKVSGAGSILGIPVYSNVNWGLVYNNARIDLSPVVQTNFIFSQDNTDNQMVPGRVYELKVVIRPLTGNFIAGYYGDQAGMLDKTTETTNKRVGYFGFKGYSQNNTYTTGIAYPETIMNGSKYNLYSIPADMTNNTASQKSSIVLEVQGKHERLDLVALSLFGYFGEGSSPNSTGISYPNVDRILGPTPNQWNNGITVQSPFFPTNVYTTSPSDVSSDYYMYRVPNKMQLILKPRASSDTGTCNNGSTSTYGDDLANAMTNFKFIPYGTNGNTYTTWIWENRHTSDDKRFWGSFLPHNAPYTFRIYENTSVYNLTNAKKFGTNNTNFKVGFSDLLVKNMIMNTNANTKSTLYPTKVRDGIIKEITSFDRNGVGFLAVKIECEDEQTFINEVDITGVFTGSTATKTLKFDINRTLTNGATQGDGKPYFNRYYSEAKPHKETLDINREAFKHYRVWEFIINDSTNGFMIEGNNYTLDIKQVISGTEVSGQAEDATILEDSVRYRSIILKTKGNNITESEIFYDFKYYINDNGFDVSALPSHAIGMSLVPTHMVMPVIFSYGSGQLL